MIAQVCINYQDANVDKVFDYLVPTHLENSIEIGKRVYVSFGVSNRIVEGLVVGIKQTTDIEENKIKCVLAVIDKFSIVSKEQIELAFSMKNYYALNLGEALSLVIPPFVSSKQIYNICAKKCEENKNLDDDLKELYESILKKPVSINSKLVKENKEKIVKLFLEGLLEFDLKNFDTRENTEKNLPRVEPEFNLTEEQNKALNNIISAFDEGGYRNILLFGVTGSGKTEVYIRAIQYVIEKGKSVIFMVPEISLTPQMIENVQSRIGNKVLVYHSKMKSIDRLNSWLAARNKEAVVVIGPRSAVFAPVKNLGLIIVDEEHEPSYKSEKSPRINAVEVAQMRAKINNIPIILGSATPSIEHYYYAKKGKYSLCTLKNRINKTLPEVLIVDMKKEILEGNKSIFSRLLLSEIENNLKKGEQVLLFLNRRGYSPIVICRECGYVYMCKNCSISLTYHKEGYLKCHYCGYKEEYKGVCTKCNSRYVRQYGSGTQKIEEEIKAYFKDARVLRMDSDTTSKKDATEQIVKKFREKEADILVGTQMIAKGLHFPDLTLVGVIDADILLNMPDFRSRERTFQLLTQVAGRSGREKPGKVIIQTFNPEDYSIVFASKHDYESFYAQEMKLRKMMVYPPYSYVVNFVTVAREENMAKRGIEHVYALLKENEMENDMKIYGPSENPIFKIENQYRYHILVKFKRAGQMISIANLIKERYNYSNASLIIDVNPLDTL
ncbi:replication restart DNA helicase PriA [Caldicellulosiruptor bescii]|uniref:Replication restart protein PriA n=2 Tax=Caldicellulosiruptor bescii TaxID=31899 RepID=B9MR35_CALBD|nr:primosomal protein N' [Caldicellulosiruptor bescii]ACM60139.1 primosomal protein N' [Caldicellulosiruptor bescii DSM 6725]PBC87554.1 replication restart DNA helicase PriA [Caldicellulosiruptor bescii]PBC90487.1 replication restart DNA helicase PriA [Caldicellulosiruptor bescii]PBD04081.1 replication restart DNA helicase PriA [Caldicellulosiruptor bescii]PBD06284.1 replication restart DNA helicase PriA [Caldicellulosiruptor bescii]